MPGAFTPLLCRSRGPRAFTPLHCRSWGPRAFTPRHCRSRGPRGFTPLHFRSWGPRGSSNSPYRSCFAKILVINVLHLQADAGEDKLMPPGTGQIASLLTINLLEKAVVRGDLLEALMQAFVLPPAELRSAAPHSGPSPCHFERSTKCEVEKSIK